MLTGSGKAILCFISCIVIVFELSMTPKTVGIFYFPYIERLFLKLIVSVLKEIRQDFDSSHILDYLNFFTIYDRLRRPK